MRLYEHIRHDHFIGKLGMFSFVARIDMVGDIKPGPAIKPAGFDTADVIGGQIIAEFVPFVCAHPKLITAWTKCDPDGISNSPRTNFCPLPSGLNSKMRARSASAALSESFEREPIETYIFLPSGKKTMSRVQCPPLRRKAAPPESFTLNFSVGPRALRSPFR